MEGLYDFPLLEVESAALTWRTTMIQNQDQEKIWIISLFPEKIQQMAACVALDEKGRSLYIP